MTELYDVSPDERGNRAVEGLMCSAIGIDVTAEQSTGSVILGAGRPAAVSVAGATKLSVAEIAPSEEASTLRVASLTAQHLNRHVRIHSRGNGDGVQGQLFAVRHERAWSVLELSVMNQSVTIQVPHAGDSVVLTLLDGEPAEAAN